MYTRTKLLVTVVLFLPLAGAAGYVCNYLAIRHYQSLSPPPGQFFVVEGRRMHLYCAGAGSPTVVLENGLGNNWISWQLVQPGLARITRVCSYDRAGIGWSDPDPGPRDAVVISDQLHELLQQAGISDRLLLVGQSAGGLYVRRFATKYRADVDGLVLVDSAIPEAFDRIPASRVTSEKSKRWHRQALYQRIQDVFGISRLLGQCDGGLPVSLKTYEPWARAAACRPAYETGFVRELDAYEISAREVANTTFDNLPLLVISQDPDRSKTGMSPEELTAIPIFAAMQEDLKKLSNCSRRIIARNSGHPVPIDRPEVIVAAVKQMILQTRGTAVLQGCDGATFTQ